MGEMSYAAPPYDSADARKTDDMLLQIIDEANASQWFDTLSAFEQASHKAMGQSLAAGQSGILLDAEGAQKGAYLIIGTQPIWEAAAAAKNLPARRYQLAEDCLDKDLIHDIALGFALGAYQPHLLGTINDGDEADSNFATCHLSSPDSRANALARGTILCRDLINSPANQMTPTTLADEATALAAAYDATITITSGSALEAGFPAIHIVGRAAEVAPCLIDMRWGTKGPKITLVGKGVTFDSGGLDLKPSKAMEMMKKDMGGAAHVLGLALAIMAQGLPVQLRVLIGAAENAVSEKSMRPMDVIDTRAGIKVEVGNTDAEGRLVLADALDLAREDAPDFLVDFATLTGAARVALGTSCPALFCNHDETAAAIMKAGKEEQDPIWQLPLFEPYDAQLDTGHMALSSTGQSGYGGAITAALFLRRFTGAEINWAHIDVMAWNLASKPGRPKGGEAMGLRAIYNYIETLI